MSLWGPRSFKPPHLPSGEKSYKQQQQEAQVARTQGILVVALKKEEPRYVAWWLYRNKISKMNKKQEEVRMEHGEPHLAPVYHPKKKNSGLVLREEIIGEPLLPVISLRVSKDSSKCSVRPRQFSQQCRGISSPCHSVIIFSDCIMQMLSDGNQ